MTLTENSPNTMPSAKPEDITQVFEQHGYAIVGECLSEQSCNTLGRHFENDCYGQRELLTMEAIQELARSPQVLRLAKAILGSQVFAVSGTFFNKTSSANWKVPWHQDRMIKVEERFDSEDWGPWAVKGGVIHVQPPASVITKVLAIRLHLDDCPAENGALRVIPGSNQFGFLNPEQTRSLLTQPETTCPVPKGGALVMSPLLLHSSSPSNSPGLRRVIHLEFAAENLPKPFKWRYRVA